jgi:hypothetical protein
MLQMLRILVSFLFLSAMHSTAGAAFRAARDLSQTASDGEPTTRVWRNAPDPEGG